MWVLNHGQIFSQLYKFSRLQFQCQIFKLTLQKQLVQVKQMNPEIYSTNQNYQGQTRVQSFKFSKHQKKSINFQLLSQTFQTPLKEHKYFQESTSKQSDSISNEDVQIDNCVPKMPFVPYKDSFLNFKGIQHIQINRARIIDWFVDVCYIYGQSWRTLFYTIAIFDRMIIEKGNINLGNIHLYGSTCLFIASKYIQIQSLTLQNLCSNINYNKFKKNQILKCESQIFNFLCLNTKNKSMHFPTFVERVYDRFWGITDQQAKQICVEILYALQAPLMVFDQQMDISQKRLVEQVAFSLKEGERYRKCWEVENHYLVEFGCLNIRRYAKKLKI